MHEDLRSLAESWMRASAMDLSLAVELADRLPPPACFHALQSAEKTLKALLIVLNGDAPRTHLVCILLNEIHALGTLPIPNDIITGLQPLDQYYLPTRYPDALGGGDAMMTYSSAQARKAAQAAKSLRLGTNTATPHGLARARIRNRSAHVNLP